MYAQKAWKSIKIWIRYAQANQLHYQTLQPLLISKAICAVYHADLDDSSNIIVGVDLHRKIDNAGSWAAAYTSGKKHNWKMALSLAFQNSGDIQRSSISRLTEFWDIVEPVCYTTASRGVFSR